MAVIQFSENKSGAIDFSQLQKNSRKLAAGMIAPASEQVRCEIAPEHAAEPIKSIDDINRISGRGYYVKKFKKNGISCSRL